MATITRTRAVSAFSFTAAWLSFIATVVFLVLLTLLHFIKPELDPSWHFISEYEIGNFGWLMQLAFLSLALSHVALATAIRPYVRGIAGWIGLSCMLIAAAGMVVASVFITDPIMASPEAMTTGGRLHSLGGTLGIAGLFGTLIVSWKLSRNAAWFSARRAVLGAMGLNLLAFVVNFVSMGAMLSQSNGQFGPDVLVGLPNRFGILSACVWLIVVAWNAIKMRRLPTLNEVTRS